MLIGEEPLPGPPELLAHRARDRPGDPGRAPHRERRRPRGASGRAQLGDLRVRKRAHLDLVAFLIVANHNEAVVGIVPFVEMRRAAGAVVPDSAALLEGLHTLSVGGHDLRARRAVADLDDPRLEYGPIGA